MSKESVTVAGIDCGTNSIRLKSHVSMPMACMRWCRASCV